MRFDGTFAGIVGGEGEFEILVETVEEAAQIGRTTIQVFARRARIDDPEALCRGRHQLHQADGTGWRDGIGVVPGFRGHDCMQQGNVEMLPGGGFTCRRVIRQRACPVWAGDLKLIGVGGGEFELVLFRLRFVFRRCLPGKQYA